MPLTKVSSKLMQQNSIPVVTGTSRNLIVKNNVTNPNFQLDITADEIVVRDSSSGNSLLLSSFIKTLDITASGINGLDTGTEAISTWYYVYAIAKSDGTMQSLISTSSTAPVMPSGYTFKALLGAVRNDGSGHFIKIYQTGNKTYIVATVALGGGTATTYTAIDLSTYVPTSITKTVIGNLAVTGGATTNYLFISSDASESTYTRFGCYIAGEAYFEHPLRTQNLYYKILTATNGTVTVTGWSI